MTAQIGATTIKNDDGEDVLALVTKLNEDGTVNLYEIGDGAGPFGWTYRQNVALDHDAAELDTEPAAGGPADTPEALPADTLPPQPPAANVERQPGTGTYTGDNPETGE